MASLPKTAGNGSPAASARPPVLPGLQCLRGLAALSVAFLHITQQAGAFVGRPGSPAYPWLRPLPWGAGVDVFFVISGFVMVWSSLPLFGTPGAAGTFVGRRLARVVPLYWLFTLLFLLVMTAAPHALNEGAPDVGLIVSSFLFFPWQREGGLVQPVFGLGWTLNYEMLFYAIFALFVRFSARIAVPAVVGSVVALAAVGFIVRPAAVPLAFWTNSIVLEFAFGALLAVLALRVHLGLGGRLVLAAAALAGLVAADRSTGLPEGLAFGVPCAALVAAFAFRTADGIPTATPRSGVRLGDASYALYLVHPFPMRALELIWLRLGLTGLPGVLAYIAVGIVSSVLLALFVHDRIERPLTGAARRLFGTRRARNSASRLRGG